MDVPHIIHVPECPSLAGVDLVNRQDHYPSSRRPAVYVNKVRRLAISNNWP